MGGFASGVTIVTTWEAGEPVGSTISAFASVSLTPPLLLVCLDLANPIRGALEAAGRFGVNILSEPHEAVARRFAREPLTGRFDEFAWRAAPQGAPRLDAAAVFIDCTVEHIHLAGDHLIVVGRGTGVEHGEAGPPLIHHRGRFQRLAPGA
jgi:3-hydroxy-9,10-secoandrosta-1,3,5(10)-triene-9,17-dione monooxygenase reductase component